MEATLDYAESHFVQLLQCVEKGEEVVLSRDSVPVARIVPVIRPPQGVRPKVGTITSGPVRWDKESFATLDDARLMELDFLRWSLGPLENEMKIAVAAKLFESGWLSSAQAASIAGMERVPFLQSLHRHGVSMINLDEEELDKEFASARYAFSDH